MASHVVPLDPVAILVVQHGQASLVVELLQPLDGDADVVLCLDGTLLDALVVVRLGDSSLPSARPGRLWVRDVGGRDSPIAGSRPEPSVHVDRLEMGTVAPFVLEVALAPRGVD